MRQLSHPSAIQRGWFMRQTLVPIAALLLGAAILLVGTGLQAVLLPVRAGLEGFSILSIGFMGATHSVGFIAGCFVTPWMISRVGHIRTLAVLSAVAAATVLLYPLLVNETAWVLLRVVTGLSLAGLAMITESWLNEKATNTSRGVVFSIYMVVNLGAVTVGTLLLGTADPSAFNLFAITAIALACSLIPTALTRASAPTPVSSVKMNLRRLYAISPVGVGGCLAVGLANGAFGALGAVFAQRLGLETADIALFMAASLLGGALAQFPLGKLSDRIDRRKVILLCTLSAASIGVALVVAPLFMPELSPAVFIGAMAVYGFFIYPLYPIAVSHANDFTPRDEFVSTSGGLLVVYGIGAVIGPALGALFMRQMGDGGLFAFTALIHALFAVFAVYRLRQRSALATDEKQAYVDISRSSTPAVLPMATDDPAPEPVFPDAPIPDDPGPGIPDTGPKTGPDSGPDLGPPAAENAVPPDHPGPDTPPR